MTQMQEHVVDQPGRPEAVQQAAEHMHPLTRRLVGGLLAGGIVVTGAVALSNENVQHAGQTAWNTVIDTFFDPLFDNQR